MFQWSLGLCGWVDGFLAAGTIGCKLDLATGVASSQSIPPNQHYRRPYCPLPVSASSTLDLVAYNAWQLGGTAILETWVPSTCSHGELVKPSPDM